MDKGITKDIQCFILSHVKKILMLLMAFAVLFGCAPEKKLTRGMFQKQNKYTASMEASRSIPAVEKKEPLFYPTLPERPRLQLLYSFTEENFREFNGGNRFFLQIKRPHDIGAAQGKIYVSDRAYKKITVIDLVLHELEQITGDYESAGIWVTDDDYKYAADINKKNIAVYGPDNKLVRIYDAGNEFEKPVDVAVYKNKIYVCDLNKHMIFIIDKDSGSIIQSVGGVGKEDGRFYKPTHVIVDREGNFYVNDFFNFRVQKFDAEGNYLKSFGYPGDTLGALARPKGISLDKEEHLYVVDAAFENVQIFDDRTTDLLLFFGGFGMTPGSMYLPNGIYIDYDNVWYFEKYADRDFKVKYLVYVGNTLGPIKLNIYGFGDWTGEMKKGNVNEDIK
ncbi:MAG: hypothetical protein C4538_11815 [Nitrospiraceae bacterium]|nr:MAG: hypothetical protein C4538_11815 [Nitrospiraceae bacterium]